MHMQSQSFANDLYLLNLKNLMVVLISEELWILCLSLDLDRTPRTEKDQCVMDGQKSGYDKAMKKIGNLCMEEAQNIARENAFNAFQEVWYKHRGTSIICL